MDKRKSSWTKVLIAGMILILLTQGCGTKSGTPGAGTLPGTDKAENTTSRSIGTQQPGGTPDGTQNDNGAQTGSTQTESNTQTNEQTGSNTGTQTGTAGQGTTLQIDPKTVKPNEAGRIMVVMFHNFVESYQKGDKAYTTTFEAFTKLLGTLYDSGYRLISLNDYLNGRIDTPAGCIPMVFTFDDGTAGQFNLIEENGVWKANPRSAVGILEEFNRTHPDFGAKGTFFLNLGDQTFPGAGTLAQRLEYLTGKGFELGNHTYDHINLKQTHTADKIQQEIGENQKRMYELIPGYAFASFSLPYGAPSKELKQYVIRGEYEGVKYENRAVMEVGWDPAPSPFTAKFDPLSTHRVRASGITPVQSDLAWWLDNLKRDKQFVSDGNPSVVTVPESWSQYVDSSKLDGRTLVKY